MKYNNHIKDIDNIDEDSNIPSDEEIQ